MYNLKNKSIIITGGAGLLGGAFSRACAESDANVIIVDIDEKKGNGITESLKKETNNSNIIFQKCDITNISDIQILIDRALDKFSKIDCLVNNAYPRNKNYGKKFEDIDYKDFCENVDMHLGGYFLMTQQVAKVMMRQNHGNIINMASIYGFTAPRFEIYEGTEMTVPAEYAAIKGAIINLTKYLASYLGKCNIRVNAISPGGVYDKQPDTFVKAYSKKVVLGDRMANADDLINVLIFLLSDASKYITGQNHIVDGGWSL
ncbi:MAG: gluconate 5-dehydrogenase [Candidatus Methanoperedens nitroreducens]|uniref:Gluconate 5-dehydrogenase n=2 Tax=Candidatus Methanoperedens TaxID=1392997 RepID=A0A0P7ZEK4_9EURY|nr:MAG: SDR family oxidoreductase [Candidatus Methanoperedens sp.]KPQ41953.1 MAG: gluconate 5-dehydrogenase [Candidatus Methanoperedens sp. BLZ1]